MIDVALGGRAAEEMVYGHDDVTSGCSSDLMRATDVASRMIKVGRQGDTADASTTGLVKKSGWWRMATTSRCISAGRKRTRLRAKSGRKRASSELVPAHAAASSTMAWAARSGCSRREKTSCTGWVGRGASQ